MPFTKDQVSYFLNADVASDFSSQPPSSQAILTNLIYSDMNLLEVESGNEFAMEVWRLVSRAIATQKWGLRFWGIWKWTLKDAVKKVSKEVVSQKARKVDTLIQQAMADLDVNAAG